MPAKDIGEKLEKILTSKWFHILLIVLGVAFILLGAFHTEVWFDESYTIALVRHDYSEIIKIDAGDVHPVLYYLLLKAFTLVFGNSILVCRLFSTLAGILMSVIGFTHIRKDFGAKVGLAYTFLAIFLPCMSVYSTEIRMYSWTMLFTTLSGIYAYRVVKQNRVKNWLLFAIYSLLAAHCHYYGLVSVAIINGLLFLHILFSKKHIIAFLITAIVEVLGYLPWLPVFLKQVTAVSQSYWIPLNLADTVMAPLGVQFYGRLPIWITVVYTIVMYAYIIYQIICTKIQNRKLKNSKEDTKDTKNTNLTLIANCLLVHFILFFGMLIVTVTVKPIMYYRYMLITTGILIFPFAYFIANSNKKHQKIISCLIVIITLILSIYNNIIVMKRNYDSSNKSEVEYVKEIYTKLKQEQNKEPVILYQDIFHATNIQVQMPEYNWYIYYTDENHTTKEYENFRITLKATFDEDFLEKYEGKIIIIDHDRLEWYNEIANKYGLKEIETKYISVSYSEKTYAIITAEK